MRQKKEVVQEVPVLVGKDVITPDDVSKAISGDKEALIEQLARAKQVAIEQLEARKQAEVNGNNITNMRTKEELEAEVQRREAELNAAMASAGINNSSKASPIYQSQNVNIEAKHLQAEQEAQSRVKPDVVSQNYNSNLNTNNVSVVNATNQTNIVNTPSNQTTIINTQNNQTVPINTNVQTTPQNSNVNINAINTPIGNVNGSVVNTSINNSVNGQTMFTKSQMKEQKRLAKEEKKAKSNFKYYMTIILFVGIFVLVYFLPNISNYFSMLKAEKQRANLELVTTGTLDCELNKYDKKYDYTYDSVFTFKDSKLLKLTYKVTTKGDKNNDQLELSSLNNECNNLKNYTSSLEGIIVRCSLSNGVNINEQVLRYEELDVSKVTTAYLEAGGIYPNFEKDQNIDEIEKSMKATGYTCNRYK